MIKNALICKNTNYYSIFLLASLKADVYIPTNIKRECTFIKLKITMTMLNININILTRLEESSTRSFI
jgi:hypothetical protein